MLVYLLTLCDTAEPDFGDGSTKQRVNDILYAGVPYDSFLSATNAAEAWIEELFADAGLPFDLKAVTFEDIGTQPGGEEPGAHASVPYMDGALHAMVRPMFVGACVRL